MICLLIFFFCDIHPFWCFLNFLNLDLVTDINIGKFSVTDASITCVSFYSPFSVIPATHMLHLCSYSQFLGYPALFFPPSPLFSFPVYFSSLVVSMKICSRSDFFFFFSVAYSLLSLSEKFFIYVAVVLISRIYFGTFLGFPFFCFH